MLKITHWGLCLVLLLFLPEPLYANTFDTLITKVDYTDIENRKIVEGGYIGIKDGKITYIGATPSPGPQTANQIIDGSSLVALPGFIDTHTHLWQHVAKSFYPNGNLQQWVRIYSYAHYFNDTSLYDVTLAAVKQAQLSGITTVSDFASVNFSDTALLRTCKALNDGGMDGIVVWWNPAAFIPYKYKKQIIPWLNKKCGPIDIWMGQGPLSFFKFPVIKEGIMLAEELGLGITEHTMENVQEQRDVYKKLSDYYNAYQAKLSEEDRTALKKLLQARPLSKVDSMVAIERLAGQILGNEILSKDLTAEERKRLVGLSVYNKYFSQIPVLDFLGALDQKKPYLSIHSVWQNAADISVYAEKKVSVSHNPGSNLYLSSGVSPTIDYQKKKVNWSLGTDGAASNDGINFFKAMRAAWNIQKIHFLNSDYIAKNLGSWNILEAATLGGARALGIDGKTGSLTKGKEADIVLLTKNELGLSPWVIGTNAAPLLVYGANKRNVSHVYSNGKLVVEGGKLVGMSEKVLSDKLTAAAKTLIDLKKNGKTLQFDVIGSEEMTGPYYGYHSVRIADEVKVTIKNETKGDRITEIAFSGQTFGGAAAPMLSPQTLKRFPMKAPKKWWDKTITLQPGGDVTITKAKNSYAYEITIKNGGKNERITREGTAEQLYFWLNYR